MIVFETRFENLERLIDEAGGVPQLALKLGFNVRELEKRASRKLTISTDLSVLLERVMGKPHGWMSCKHGPMCGHLTAVTPPAKKVVTKGVTKGGRKRVCGRWANPWW